MHAYLTTRWNAIGQKLTELAAEVPAEHYDARPAAGTRTFAEQLRHVAYWNDYCRDALEGKSPDGSANTYDEAQFHDKDAVLRLLREGLNGVSAALARASATGDGQYLEQVEAFIEHNCEHYGQLVVYARLHGVVPPASQEGH